MPVDFATLDTINRRVNQGIKYTTDIAQYGFEEFWANADQSKRGDCEDYCISKYVGLRGEGFPQDTLNMAICKLQGTYHAVLVVTLDGEDYVLCNNLEKPTRWQSLPNCYELISRTDNGKFDHWYEIAK